MSNLRFRRVMRLDTIQRHFRLFRLCWEFGTPGDGVGYSVKLTFGLQPVLFRYRRNASRDWEVAVCGLRVHYGRSYGGRFA